MPVGAYEELLNALGSKIVEPSGLFRLRATGGIPIGGAFLGCPAFLPYIESVPDAHVRLEPRRVESGELSVEYDKSFIRLRAHARVCGAWDVLIKEGEQAGFDDELLLSFVDKALEQEIIERGDRPGWDSDVETDVYRTMPSRCIWMPHLFWTRAVPLGAPVQLLPCGTRAASLSK